MQYIDFLKPIRVHFIGIGGISMSALAELLAHKGFTVSGSDRKASPVTDHLETLGVSICCPQAASNITEDIKLVVYTGAISEDNPEMVRAHELGIPVIERGRLVGDIMLHYRHNYAVAGSHGKTTTTSMLSLIWLEENSDPTILVGGILGAIGSNIRIGSEDSFIIEACEYTDSFLKFHPTGTIITNIEPEHLDYFKTFENEKASFTKYAELLPAEGLLVVCDSIADRGQLFSSVKCPMITYGFSSSADYSAADISYDELGHPSYTLLKGGEPLGRIELSVFGEHNVLNSMGAAALAIGSGIPFGTVARGLKKYMGTDRRFQLKGTIGGVTIFDDYGHHPTEISATMAVAKRYPHTRLVVVFQPHTYSRTAAFLHEFADALSAADIIVLTDIFAAREVNTFNISSNDIAKILKEKYSKEVYYFPSFGEVDNFLLQKCFTGDLLITLGAGDVVKIGEALLGM